MNFDKNTLNKQSMNKFQKSIRDGINKNMSFPPTKKPPKFKKPKRRIVPITAKQKNKFGKNKNDKTPFYMRSLRVSNKKCDNCKDGGNVIDDPRAGRIVCTRCGIVVETSFISETSEWRTFADNDRSGPDMNRVGSAGHYLLEDSKDLSTMIVRREGGYLADLNESTNSHANSKLRNAIQIIRKKCDANGLNLGQKIQNASAEIYKQLLEKSEMKSKKTAPMIATCVYLGAKVCGAPRQLKEITKIFKVEKMEVRKVHTQIKKFQAKGEITIAKGYQNSVSGDSTSVIYAQKYCMDLKLPSEIHRGVTNIIKNMEKKGILNGKLPATKSGIALYIAANIFTKNDSITNTNNNNNSKSKSTYTISLSEISKQCNVTEQTLYQTFKRISSQIRGVIPNGYGNPVLINSLLNK